MGVAAAIVGSAVVGGVAAVASSNASSNAAKDSAKVSQEISDESLALQAALAEQQRADFEPWRVAGETALTQIEEGIASGAFQVGTVDVTQDPGYEFRMSEGIEALDKSAASRGRLLSGAQDKAITDYSQNVASQEYANAYARESNEKANQYNMLSALSQGGQSSAAGQAQASSNLATQSTNTLSNLSTDLSNSAYATGQARAGAYTGAATSVNQAAQNWLTYKAL